PTTTRAPTPWTTSTAPHWASTAAASPSPLPCTPRTSPAKTGFRKWGTAPVTCLRNRDPGRDPPARRDIAADRVGGGLLDVAAATAGRGARPGSCAGGQGDR